MGEAIGEALPFAVGVALSPMPIVAIVLMLLTPHARSNGAAFVVGWVVAVAVLGGVLLALAGPADASDDGAPADWVSWLKLVLGLLLVLLALRGRGRRPDEGEEVAAPKWMGALGGFTPVKAAAAGVALGAANPKNLLLIVGGVAAVAGTGIAGSDEVVVWIVFTVIATAGVAAPMVIYLALGDHAGDVLDRVNAWMVRNNAAVMAVLCLIIGVKLVGDAISGLSA